MSKKSYWHLKNKSKILWIGLAVLIAITVILAIFLPKDTEKKSADAAEPDEATGYAGEDVYTEEYTWNDSSESTVSYFVNTQSSMPPKYIIDFEFTQKAYFFFFLFEGKVTPKEMIAPNGKSYPFTNMETSIGEAVNWWNRNGMLKGKIVIESYSYNAKFIIYRGSRSDITPALVNALYSGFGYGEECEEKGINVGYKNGYNNGYLAGEKDGNQSGYQEGLQQAQYNIFANSKFDFKIRKDNVDLSSYDKNGIKPLFITNGVSFDPIRDYFLTLGSDATGAPFGTVTVTLNVNPFIYNEDTLKFWAASNNTVPAEVTINTTNNDIYLLKMENPVTPGTPLTEGGIYRTYDGTTLLTVITTPIKSFTFTLNLYYPYLAEKTFSFSVLGQTGYTSGYTNGFNDGKNAGFSEGNKAGYDSGLKAGYDDGYNTGYSKGMIAAGDYTFLSLMTSVVDAPVKAFMGLLDFNILGFNVAKLIIALLSVALLLKIIATFSKGG